MKQLERLLFTSCDIIPTVKNGKIVMTIVDMNRYPEGLNHHEVNSGGKLSKTIKEVVRKTGSNKILLTSKRYKFNQIFYKLNMDLIKGWLEEDGKTVWLTPGFTGIYIDPRAHVSPRFHNERIESVFNHNDIHPLIDPTGFKDLRKLYILWKHVEDGEVDFIHSPFGSWAFTTKHELYEEIRRVVSEKGVDFIDIPKYSVVSNHESLESEIEKIISEHGSAVIKSPVGFGGSASLITNLTQLRDIKVRFPLLVEEPVERQLVEISEVGSGRLRRMLGRWQIDEWKRYPGHYSIDLVQLVACGEPISCVIKVSPGSVEQDAKNYIPARKGMTFVFPQVEDPYTGIIDLGDTVKHVDKYLFNVLHKRNFGVEEDKYAKNALESYDLKSWLSMSRIAGEIAYEAMNRVVKRIEEKWENKIEKAYRKLRREYIQLYKEDVKLEISDFKNRIKIPRWKY